MKTMKKLIFTLLVLVIFTGNSFAQDNYKSGSLLWKISGGGLDKASYILGTFHLKASNYLDQIPGARTSLSSSEQIIGEVDMSDIMAQVLKMQQKMMMPSDTTYKMLYSESDYQFVDKELKSMLGTGLEQLGVIIPAGIQMSLLQVLIMKNYPNVISMDALDASIQKVAKEEQKPIVGLETVDHQIYVLFESMSLQHQANSLLCGIKSHEGKSLGEGMLNDLQKMEGMYDNADLNGLYKLMKEDPCQDLQNEEIINKSRNDAWMKKLPDLMKEKSSFIAVGALHLAGEEGLLHQLEQAGYTVEAVKN
jgi:uncharacterized protein YbaP (TraB family)